MYNMNVIADIYIYIYIYIIYIYLIRIIYQLSVVLQ